MSRTAFPPADPDFPAFATALWEDGSVVSQLLPVKQRGRKYVKARQQALAGLIWLAYHGSYRHKKNPLASSFGMELLESATCLRSSNATARTRWLSPFFDFDTGRTVGCSRKARLTKAYVLNAETRAAARAAKMTARVNSRRSIEDQPADCSPVIREVTSEMAKNAFAEMTRMGLVKAAAYLHGAVEDIPVEGGLPNEYAGTFSNGRPYPFARSHLVGMPRVAREALLRETGWWDYDIRSCHVSLFLSLGQHFGIGLPLLSQYAADKERQHDEWAGLVNHHSPDDFKELVLGFLNGGSLDVKYQSAIWEKLCYGLTPDNHIVQDRALHWVALPSVRDLHAEVANACAVLVENYSRPIRTLVKPTALTNDPDIEPESVPALLAWNAVNHVIAAKTPGQVLSHILTGLEQHTMQYLMSRVPHGSVVATMYDGWVSRVELSDAERESLELGLSFHSAEALGLPLSLSLKGKQFAPADPQEDF
jgi:hypothetical protein